MLRPALVLLAAVGLAVVHTVPLSSPTVFVDGPFPSPRSEEAEPLLPHAHSTLSYGTVAGTVAAYGTEVHLGIPCTHPVGPHRTEYSLCWQTLHRL